MKHLRFIVRLTREHYRYFFQDGKSGGIWQLIIEGFLAVLATRWILHANPIFDSTVVGGLLAGMGMFSSILITVLVLLHGQVTKETGHDFDIAQTESETFPKNLKVGMKALHLEAKVETIKTLFNDIAFCLLLSMASAVLMILSMVVKGRIQVVSEIAFVVLGLKMLLVIYEFCRKLYYVLEDDFNQASTPPA
jgi:hypothetical protein